MQNKIITFKDKCDFLNAMFSVEENQEIDNSDNKISEEMYRVLPIDSIWMMEEF